MTYIRYDTVKTPENLALMSAWKKSETISDASLKEEIQDALEVVMRAALLRFQKMKHDERERMLVGSMVKLADAGRYRIAADNLDLSLTAWARLAFENQVAKQTAEALRVRGRHEAGE